MGKGLAFLSKKEFNPGNIRNQEAVWLAENRANEEKKKVMEVVKKREEERQIEKLQKTALESAALAQARRVAETKAQIEAMEKRLKEKQRQKEEAEREQQLELEESAKNPKVAKPGYLGIDMRFSPSSLNLSEWVAAKPADKPVELRAPEKEKIKFAFSGTTEGNVETKQEEDEHEEPAKRKEKVLPHLVIPLTPLPDIKMNPSKRTKVESTAALEWKKRRQELAQERQISGQS